jgi:hypothetical protein
MFVVLMARASQSQRENSAYCWILLVSFLGYSLTLKVEVICSTKMLGFFHTSGLNNPEGSTPSFNNCIQGIYCLGKFQPTFKGENKVVSVFN